MQPQAQEPVVKMKARIIKAKLSPGENSWLDLHK